MSVYEKYVAGKDGWSPWMRPIRKGYRLACCDCGLVHVCEFRIVKTYKGNHVEFRVRRNNRATAGIRRGMKASGNKLQK